MFLECFSSAEDVFSNFAVPKDQREGIHIISAWYSHEDYEGSAEVVFMKDGEVYTVNGGHCSCYGLEDQWDPEKVEDRVLVMQYEEILNKGNPQPIRKTHMEYVIKQLAHIPLEDALFS